MSRGQKVISTLTIKWQILLCMEAMAYAVGVFFICFLSGLPLIWSILAASAVGVLASLFLKPWLITHDTTSQYIDSQIRQVENSASLLLQSDDTLPSLARLQKAKIDSLISSREVKVKLPYQYFVKGFAVMLVGVLFGSGIQYFKHHTNALPKSENVNETLITPVTDSTAQPNSIPEIVEMSARISPPSYTGLKSDVSQNMNLRMLHGSRIQWQVKFDGPVEAVRLLETTNKGKYDFKGEKEGFELDLKGNNNTFYNLEYEDMHGQYHSTEIFKLEVYNDLAPMIELEGINQYTLLEYDQLSPLSFIANIRDDYGIKEATIVATVSKGSGESVKFREQRMSFDKPWRAGGKSLKLKKTLDLKKLNMDPGDELYFYVEATDYKPEMIGARSETYFISINDTSTYEFFVEGSLGVDLMPEYFRSQRQLIIDTEKLIKNKSEISKKEFNFTSNELGYDQKSLRIKYGQFMGEEFETGIAHEDSPEEGEFDSEDPLEEYSHDHDGDNEHNLVEEHSEEEEDPLHEYKHDHDDPEEATFFTVNIRSKLRQAMTEMWDAELYLRLFQPEKSLPYQYKALKLIKEIKNHARIYVHRIGFDPPPIKEDKRLTGDLEEVKDSDFTKELQKEDQYASIKSAVALLDKKVNGNNGSTYLNKKEKSLFHLAGDELATMAIAYPGKYLNTLQKLKMLSSSDKEYSNAFLKEVRAELLKALPQAKKEPYQQATSLDELDRLFLNKINEYKQ